MHVNKEREKRTLEASVDVANMAFGQGAQALREVDERRALACVRATQTDDSDLRQTAGVCLEHSVDERGRANADGGNVGRREGGLFKNAADRDLDTRRDVGGGGGLVVGEYAAGGLAETADVDQDAVRVRS